MGKRGPAPTPRIFDELRGNPSKKTLNDNEPTPDLLDDLEPPGDLPPRAKEKYHEAARVLRDMRVLTEADQELLVRYCRLWERFMMNYEKSLQMGDEITKLEVDPTRTDGRMRIKSSQVAPWATQYRTLGRELLRMEQEFGLTPSSRSQVTIHANKADDPISAFISKRSDRARA
jgi:P27 family predicted phage terminase small subunit